MVESVTPAGSLRRGKETIGDLDLLVTMRPGRDKQKDVDAVAEHILKYPGIDQTLAHGENKVSVLLGNGLQVDVRLLEKEMLRRGASLFHRLEGAQRGVARPRAGHGLDAQRIRADHFEGRQGLSRAKPKRKFTPS